MSHHHMMPEIFHPLAAYNSEVARGLVHTPEWQQKMAVLQHAFNEWQREQIPEDAITVNDTGTPA